MKLQLITQKPESVENSLYQALDRLIKNRLQDGVFIDEVDVKDKQYFSTLEGLESLLVPFVYLPKNRFWEPLKDNYPKLKEAIIEDIKYVLTFNKHPTPPDEQGHPYFTERKATKPYWTSECASFTLSVLTNYLDLKRKFDLATNPDEKDIIEVIENNIRWIKTCKRDQGWAWISAQQNSHPWPTWSLLDTFEELLDSLSDKISENMFQTIDKECTDVVNNIAASFKDTRPDSYFSLWKEKIINRTPYDVETAFDLSRLMLAVSLHKSQRIILPLVKMLYEWASNADFSKVNYKYHLKEKASYIYDSSLVPCIFRTLIIMAGKVKPKKIEKLDQELKQDHELVINRVYNKIMESQITHGQYQGLWGVMNGRINYELYFTERTIEALTEFLQHYKSKRPVFEKQKKNAASMKKDRIRNAGRTQPPDDTNKYTAWIPQLSARKIPEELSKNEDWRIEDLLEHYCYRLFNNTFALNAKKWGYKNIGEPKPDSRIILPDSKICFCDVKSSSGKYEITAAELRKFTDYAEEGKRLAIPMHQEVLCLFVIAPSFRGNLQQKAESFQATTSLKLVCMQAKDICKFADNVQKEGVDATKKRLIKWSLLLSKGSPLIDPGAYEKILKEWLEDLETMKI